MLSLVCGFAQERIADTRSDLIVTATSVYEPLAALHGQERFPHGAQLLLVHAGPVGEAKPEPLVNGFAASADANVSFDGTRLLFAGKKNPGDPWRVWELSLGDRSLRSLTSGVEDAIRPLYLPGGRFVYALRGPTGFQLRVQDIGGTSATAQTITFAHGSAIPADVLADGRILFESDFPLGSGSTPELFLVYSDGSGVESYRCDHGTARWGGKQLTSGDVVLTHGNGLARFTSRLAHEEHVSSPAAQYAGSLAETPASEWLLSTKKSGERHYAIRKWTQGSGTLRAVFFDPTRDLVEPVLIAPRNVPKRHPSALHPWDYSNLLALDARISREGALKGTPATVRLETEGEDGRPQLLGTAPIEPDGSYFVKVPGDKPIRFVVLDAKGSILRQERGWFWARSGEQRICVGCHAGPEHAPENRVPAVLLRTTTPVDLTLAASTTQHASAGGR